MKHGFGKGQIGGLCVIAFSLVLTAPAQGASADELFSDGVEAYRAGEYARAARAFRESASRQTAAGAFQNLGNAEWQRGRVGAAILAWEQTLWLDPSGRNAHNNLRYARETAQIEAPELTWYEIASTWLPENWWAWLTGASLWLVAAMLTLPGVLRWRRAGWQQALAALGLTVFLLCVPAQAGLWTRARLGFILRKDTPLRLSPTQEAEAVTRLAAGEPARLLRARGSFLYLRTSRTTGWVEREQFGLLCQP